MLLTVKANRTKPSSPKPSPSPKKRTKKAGQHSRCRRSPSPSQSSSSSSSSQSDSDSHSDVVMQNQQQKEIGRIMRENELLRIQLASKKKSRQFRRVKRRRSPSPQSTRDTDVESTQAMPPLTKRGSHIFQGLKRPKTNGGCLTNSKPTSRSS